MISSTSNAHIKEVAALQAKSRARLESGQFVAEGPRMVAEVPKEDLVKAYFAAGSDEHIQELAGDIGAEEVSENVFRKISATQTPQGILAVVRRKRWTYEDILQNAAKQQGPVILLEDLQDPGNLGTIVRTGEGAGIAGIVASKGTVDLTNPKTIRGTMGSIFRVPFIVEEDIKAAIGRLRQEGFQVFAAALEGSVPYDEPDYTKPCAFLIGNEGNGLRPETIAAADRAVRIPMLGKVESLNAGIAAALLMYEARRQCTK